MGAIVKGVEGKLKKVKKVWQKKKVLKKVFLAVAKFKWVMSSVHVDPKKDDWGLLSAGRSEWRQKVSVRKSFE